MTANIFLKQLESPPKENAPSSTQGNLFLKQLEGRELPESEGFIKSAWRTALQAALGYAKKYTWRADLFKMMADLQSQEVLREMSEEDPLLQGEGRQVAEQARQRGIGYLPTQKMAEEFIEEKTGAPLAAKTGLQKKIRLGGEAAGFRPGNIMAKGTAAVTAPVVAQGLEMAGAPESVSELSGLLASGVVPEANISAIKKPSGLVSRRFEKISKPTVISPERHKIISEKVESDVKSIADDLLKKHPTYQSIKSDPTYKEKIAEGFDKVSELAEQIPEKIKNRQLLSFLKRRRTTQKREMQGITSSESEETFGKEFDQILKKASEGPQEFSHKTAVDQFRKNNGELAEYFEPGKSKAFNTGKRDALLEYNRGIQELFETIHPDSEFTKLFAKQNRRWSELSDIEAIEGRLDKMFPSGKINFNEAKKILDKSKPNVRRPFERIMGKEGYKNFESLLHDLLTMENPYSLLKKAESGGFSSLSKLLGSYILHPSVAKLYGTAKLAKAALRMLLDKPQLTIQWKRALNNLKKGNLQQAEDEFVELDEAFKTTAEKTKPFGAKGRTLPEGYAEELEGKVTRAGLEQPKAYYLSPEQIKKWNLNEPVEAMSPYDKKLVSGDRSDMVRGPNKVFGNEWNILMKSNQFKKYYTDPGKGIQEMGTVGDFIKNPRLRKIYEKVLNIPVFRDTEEQGAAYNLIEKRIGICEGLSPAQFYSALIHETHHALQNIYKPDLFNFSQYSMASMEAYLRNTAERKARLAERFVKKDFERLYNLAEKVKAQGGKTARNVQPHRPRTE